MSVRVCEGGTFLNERGSCPPIKCLKGESEGRSLYIKKNAPGQEICTQVVQAKSCQTITSLYVEKEKGGAQGGAAEVCAARLSLRTTIRRRMVRL